MGIFSCEAEGESKMAASTVNIISPEEGKLSNMEATVSNGTGEGCFVGHSEWD